MPTLSFSCNADNLGPVLKSVASLTTGDITIKVNPEAEIQATPAAPVAPPQPPVADPVVSPVVSPVAKTRKPRTPKASSDATRDAILAHIRNTPEGIASEKLRPLLKLAKPKYQAIMKKLVEENAVRREGERRDVRYFPVQQNGATYV